MRPESQRFLSTFARDYLYSPDPTSEKRLSNRDEVLWVWKSHKVATVNLENRKIQEKLAAMPSVKNDTIKITSNRIALLNTLRIRFQLLDRHLFEILRLMDKCQRVPAAQSAGSSKLGSKRVAQIVKLMGIDCYMNSSRNGDSVPSLLVLDQEFALTRRILQTMIEVRKTSANIELEIVKEQDTLDRLTRYRDTGIQIVNLANFYQTSIIRIIADGYFGLSSDGKADVYNDRLTIISGDERYANSIGVKGVGEIGVVGVAAAIANAVYHATGQRVRQLPITLDKVVVS